MTAAARFLSVGLLIFSTSTARVEAQGMGTLRPGDVVRLRVFREPELSGEFSIDERGVVTFPRLGDLAIGVWPADSIKPRLTRMFSEFLRDATVEVILLRRIAITGAVLKPGLYPVDATMSLADVLALAGGPSPDGHRDAVELIRGDRTSVERVGGAGIRVVLQSGDRLHVPQRGWLSRNTWLVGTLIGAMATIIAVRTR